MIRHALAIALCVATMHAHAVDWICTSSGRSSISSTDSQDGAARRARIRRIDRTDLVQAYSGQPVLMGGTWLLAVMLPASHPDTRAAFADLGLSPEAAERMASNTSLIDRGIRVVQTPDQLINKVVINPPAVGYSSIFFGARDVASCF